MAIGWNGEIVRSPEAYTPKMRLRRMMTAVVLLLLATGHADAACRSCCMPAEAPMRTPPKAANSPKAMDSNETRSHATSMAHCQEMGRPANEPSAASRPIETGCANINMACVYHARGGDLARIAEKQSSATAQFNPEIAAARYALTSTDRRKVPITVPRRSSSPDRTVTNLRI